MIRFQSLLKLPGCLRSVESTGWAASALVHSGMLIALAGLGRPIAIEPPVAAGSREVVTLEATWNEPNAVETERVEADVLVMPGRVHVAERRYVQADIPLARWSTSMPIEVTHKSLPLPPLERTDRTSSLDRAVQTDSGANATPQLPPRDTAKVAVDARIAPAPPQSAGTQTATLPKPVSNSPPIYPARAISEGWEGMVTLRVRITAQGKVTKVEVAQSSGHEILDAAALQAVRSWQFEPARRGSRAVETVVRLPVRFVLD